MKSVAQVLYRRLRATSALVSFSPSSLFASGEQGVWLDNSDFTTLFQDAAGTTPVTGYEQFVGLRLDKRNASYSVSFNGTSSSLTIASNANLNPADGQFTWEAWINPSNWTEIFMPVYVASGTGGFWIGKNASNFVVRAYAVADQLQYGTLPTIGAWTHVAVTRDATTLRMFFNGSLVASVANSYNFTQQPIFIGSDGATPIPSLFSGSVSNIRFVKGAALYTASFTAPSSPLTAVSGTSLLTCGTTWSGNPVITNNSALASKSNPFNTGTGNHAFQSTTTARAVLSARYNLLTQTEAFDNAAWSLGQLLAFGSGSTVNATTAPNGTTTADLITPNTTFAPHSIWQAAATVASGVSYTAIWHVKPNGYTKMAIVENEVTGYYTAYDASGSGSMLSQSNATGTITALADGWYRITHTSVSSGTLFRPQLFILRADYTFGSVTSSWTPNGTSGLYIWGADLRAANESPAIPAYQRVGAAVNGTSTVIGTPDYDTVGFPAYLRYDGGDWYQTNSINFSTGATNPPLGPELVTNGDFSSGAGWTISGAGVSITGGQLVFNSAGATQYAFQSILTINKWYSVTYTVSGYSVGGVRIAAGGTNGLLRFANGTYTEYIYCTAGSQFYIITASGSNTYNIDNVSVKELTDANYAPDKMSVFAGVRKLTAQDAIVIEQSVDFSANNGTFIVSSGAAAGDYFGARGTSVGSYNSPFVAPQTTVQSVQYNIGGAVLSDEIIPRINAIITQTNPFGGSVGTGNYGNYPLYIGARAGTSLFYTGREYETIVLGRAVTATELTNTEGYMEAQTFGKDMSYVYSDELTTATGDLITAADGDQIYMTVQYV